jgi:transposase
MNMPEKTPFAAHIGLDWGDKHHDLCLQVAGTSTFEHSRVPHCPRELQRWARTMEKRFQGAPVAVALELHCGPIVSILERFPFLQLFFVNPGMLAKYREAFSPSRAKDDPTDAALALELLLRHPERLTLIEPEQPAIRSLRAVVAIRQTLRKDITRTSNRLTAALKEVFPQVLELFRDKDTEIFCDFVIRWPSPTKARAARRTSLERFFRDHHVYRKALIDKRIKAIKSLAPLTEDRAILDPRLMQLRMLAEQLLSLLRHREECEDKMAELSTQCADHKLFSSLPGAGPVTAPRLIAIFGENRNLLPTPEHAQRAFGIAPVIERSGGSCWVHWRKACDKETRQGIVEWAAQTIPLSTWAKAYYHQQISKGNRRNQAVRALAYKWLRIVHRCWRDGVEYDEAKYIDALRQRGSPLVALIDQSA